MTTNTIVSAADIRYIWGLYLLIASCRINEMSNPIIIYGVDFTQEDAAILEQFPDVRVICVTNWLRSPACIKPAAMLEAETDFVTWVDCDGFFVGNCQDLLMPDSEQDVHMRMRDPNENMRVYNQSAIPQDILRHWQNDIDQSLPNSRICTVGVTNFLSLSKTHRTCLRYWRDFMDQVLPRDNVGTIDNRNRAYHMIDESAFNALLAFSPLAPTPSPCFKLDKDPAHLYVHFGSLPKPWAAWTPRALRHYEDYVGLLDRAEKAGYRIPNGRRPHSLNRRYAALFKIIAPLTGPYYKIKRRLSRYI